MWQARAAKLLAALAVFAAAPPAPASGGNRGVPDGMALIPAGDYRPLYADSDADRRADAQSKTEWVEAFLLDRRAASNAEFLRFAREHPKWQRSRAPRIFADENYLAHWAGDDDLGGTGGVGGTGGADPDAPVVNVSWFAASAYCRSRGKTLPTVAQWERAAAASETSEDGAADPAFAQRILEWYAAPADRPLPASAGFENLHGVRDMHGLIWEWTLDFNSELVTGESRGDTGLSRQLFCGAASIGAADPRDYAAFMRRAFRSSLEGRYAVGSLGFRCAAPSSFAEKTP